MSPNSQSLLSLWFFGFTGPAEQEPLSPAKRLGVFVLLLPPAFFVCWIIFSLTSPVYRQLISGGLQAAFAFSQGNFEFSSSGSQLTFRSRARPAFEADLSMEAVDVNILFLAALLLATPGMNPRNRAVRLLMGIALLSVTHVLFIATKVEVTLIAAAHPLAGPGRLWTTLDNLLEIAGRSLFPIFIWLLLALPYMLGLVDSRKELPPQRKIGRNEPCPCGSGRKFKVCCGA